VSKVAYWRTSGAVVIALLVLSSHGHGSPLRGWKFSSLYAGGTQPVLGGTKNCARETIFPGGSGWGWLEESEKVVAWGVSDYGRAIVGQGTRPIHLELAGCVALNGLRPSTPGRGFAPLCVLGRSNQPDISTLQRTRHFYFGLTAEKAS